jgi:nitronate monooxygenase
MAAEGSAMTLQELVGVELPIIQAPMAGYQGSAMAIAVSNAGGLGSLPCASLSLQAMQTELTAIRAGTAKPFNVNFFCHATPEIDTGREAAWRKLLQPYLEEFDIVPGDTSTPLRTSFDAAAAQFLRRR